MPLSATPRKAKRTKYDRLFAVFERLAVRLAEIPDKNPRRIAEGWAAAKTQYASWLSDPTSKVTRSKIAVGLEQGLREMPQLLQSTPTQWRAAAVAAFHSAIEQELPEFYAKQAEALSKIMRRGSIRSEAEFYLVRHEVDRLEQSPDDAALLSTCYRLLDRYESP